MEVEHTPRRIQFRGRKAAAFALFAFALLTALTLASTARSEIAAPPPPQVWSDKADYAPGESVTLSGANWAPGESVHLRVNDDAGETWRRDVDVTADENGAISDQFNLPDWFVAVYNVTATGASSGTATWSFTDGNVTLHLEAAQGVANMTVTYDRWNGTNQNPNSTCSGAPTLINQTVTIPAASGTVNIPGFGGSSDSVRLKSVTTTTTTKTFDRWTSATGTQGQDKNTDSGVDVPGTPTPCISNGTGGTNGNLQDAFAHFKNSNVAPIANSQSVSTNEDTATTITLTGSDADGNNLTFAIVAGQGPNHGSLGSIGPLTCTGTAPKSCSANVVYTPAANYNGPDSFKFRVNDGTLDSSDATVSITVDSVNDDPTCSNGAATTDEDTPKAITLSCADVDGDSLTYSVVSGPSHGTVSPGTGPGRTYSPALNYNGSDSFTFKANDGSADSNVATFSLTINAVNDDPTCSNGAATTDEDTPKAITLSCADVDGDSLTYSVVSGPSHGTVSPGTGPARTYSPALNYNGSDSFTFKANDGSADSNVATFSLTINAVNDDPTCSNGAATTDEDTPKAITLSCADVDGDSLTYSVVSGPSHGTVSPGTGPGRTYSPALNYNGSDSFTFKANDGSADSNVATFSLTINAVDDAPTVTRDEASVTVDEGDTATNSGTYDDVDGDTVTVSASVGNVVTNPDGTWDWSFDTSDGPDDSQTVTITASDGTTGDEASVTFALVVNNVAPVVTAAADQSSDEGDNHSFALGSFTDPGDDGDWEVDVDWGDGSGHTMFTVSSPGSLGSKSHTNADGPNDYVVTVTVSEAGSGSTPSDSDSFDVHVNNVAPSVQFTGTPPTSANEGETKTYNYTYSDPGADTISFAAGYPSCGANGELQGTPSISSPGSFQCLFPEGPNTTNVAIRVKDEDGAFSMDVETVNIVEVAIANVAPTADLANNGPVDEGSPATVSFSNQLDPSAADTAAGFHYAYSCDGSSLGAATYAGSGSAASHNCKFGDDGSYVVKGRIIDRNDGGTTYETTVQVRNVAPTASDPSFVFDPVFGTATAGFDFSDVGWLDSMANSFFTWSIDSGNRPATISGAENVEPNATGHASDSRTLAVGCYNLTVTGTAKDDDNGASAPLAIYSNSATSVVGRGFRPPIMDNERNIAKYGNVVPVKVVLTNSCTGATVTNVPLFITIAKGVGDEAIEDTNLIAESVSAADSGSQMRTADGMYIYNLSTKSLAQNTNYTIRIRPNSTTTPYILQAVLYPKK